MCIPDCYEAFRQAERREAALDALESRRDKCGSCGCCIYPGETFWTASHSGELFCVCQSCKEDIDDSIAIAQEDEPYDV